MGHDLKLANQLFWAAKEIARIGHGEEAESRIDYFTAMICAQALFNSKELAQKFVEGTWENGEDK